MAVKISNYTLGDKLGSGGFGVVYKAIDAADAKKPPVALKRFFNATSAKPEIECLTRIWLEQGFDCPYLVRFHCAVADPGDLQFQPGLALVFELCEERSLADFIENRLQNGLPKLSAFELLNIAYHLTSGLVALHNRQLIHRDIAPRNILLARNDKGQIVAKIADLGICKYVVDTEPITIKKDSFHVAPEFYKELQQGMKTDMFSLGVVRVVYVRF